MAFDGTKPANSSAMVAAEIRTNFAACRRPLHSSVGSWANSGVAETDFASYSVPANTLSADGQALEVVARGYFAANGNTKELRVYLGASSVLVASSTYNSGRWEIRIRIQRTGAAAQVAPYSFLNHLQYPALGTGTQPTMSATLSSANTLKVTGKGGASNDVIMELFAVELVPSP